MEVDVWRGSITEDKIGKVLLMGKIETVREHCTHEDCVYRRCLKNGLPYCDYIGVEKHSRGCDISNCDKYKPGRKTRPRMHERYELYWDLEIYEIQEHYCGMQREME